MRRHVASGLIAGVALAAVALVAVPGRHIGSALAQADAKPSTKAFEQSMEAMMSHMHMPMTGDADKDFVMMMVTQHRGAIDMAKVELEYGRDPEIKELARRMIETHEGQLAAMLDWLIRAQADDHH